MATMIWGTTTINATYTVNTSTNSVSWGTWTLVPQNNREAAKQLLKKY